MKCPPPRIVALMLASTVTLLAPGFALAQMTPLLDLRQLHVRATYEGAPDQHTLLPATPFMDWERYVIAEVYGEEAGGASAEAFINSTFTPASIYAAGATTGQFQVGTGTYEAHSLSTLVFRLDTCTDYFLFTDYLAGDPGSLGWIMLGHPQGGPPLFEVNASVMWNGRLSPGEYFLEGLSKVSTVLPSQAGPTYTIFWTCQPCGNPFIWSQPEDIWRWIGQDGFFTVGTNAPNATEASYTYQWRRNRVPLANGGNLSGVNTPTLSIASVTQADTGWYDVVVSNGTIEEPSRYARLNVNTSTGVGPGEPPPGLGFTLDGATPNPASGPTSFAFRAPTLVHTNAAVLDASGRLVRSLGGGARFGAGRFTWDGRTAAGDRAPAGVYFLRVQVDDGTHVRRFVRIE